jgi:transposase
VWLARITERGSLPSSFVPPEPIRRLRTHTRYRRHLTQARTAEKQRVEKLLEDGHLKLSSVISDIHGVSGRAMLEAIIAGERNPKVLAQLARGSMRGKIARLEEALDCSFLTEQHAAVPSMMLATIDYYTAQIDELTAKIEVLAEPYLPQIEQMDAVHGTGRISAQDVIAEIGVDMTVFPPPPTWCPGPSGAPRSPSPAASAKEATPPAAATPTCPPPSAKSASAPPAPSPSSAPSTGGWSSECPRRKPSSPPATPS